ncbi:MAG: ATP-dependent HslUV protease ATP-binding subunit HslU [Candidatus Sumerlaeota bacterium]|nr:ATP-dependent HslUV protease ATP-binding subunit HslU [Candidatus Sumerlaeota bacterium]
MSPFPPSEMTPRQIVAELDKFIVGQRQAKRIVAIALRNRARRRLLPDHLRDEVSPKNILMMGPTGVGKTEIARRLARLARAPFVKVEATKYTEVGYVGRDVESMVRDLVETAIRLVREEKAEGLRDAVEEVVLNKILDLREPPPSGVRKHQRTEDGKPITEYELPPMSGSESDANHPAARWWRKREALKVPLIEGRLDEDEVEITVKKRAQSPLSMMQFPMGPGGGGGGMDPGMEQLQGLFDQLAPKKEKKVRLRIAEARKVLFDEEIEGLLDQEKIKIEAVERAQQDGIIFIDEFDKIAGNRAGESRGPDVSREGVQRDILPIIEGSTIFTKYGMVTTDHVLFIAAGAFHVAKPSDLIPELQGRLPLRVELEPLTAKDFERILTEPDNALTLQYTELLKTEGIELVWEKDGIEEIARIAAEVNATTENIGARRLHTLLEKILEEVSFEAPDMGHGRIVINWAFVRQALGEILKNQDLSRYIL